MKFTKKNERSTILKEENLSENIKIVNDDCLNYMATLSDKSIDLVLTDPPYGINLKYDQYADTEDNWYTLMEKALPEIIRVSRMAILPSCQIKRLKWIYQNFPPDWLICWYKGSPGHASYIGFNDWEPHLVYGRTKNRMYMHDYFQTKGSPKKETFGHPCPKPIEWAYWLIERATEEGDLVLDPFAGSFTTGVACVILNRKFIGIEISNNYYDIGKQRLIDSFTKGGENGKTK